MRIRSTAKTMTAAAVIMAASILLSRFMGLIRDKVISYYYGATPESDVYFASFVVPDFINYLLAGGYFSITLIPLLAEKFEGDEADGWRFFSAVFLWIGIVITGLTLAAEVCAPQLARVAAPGFSPEETARLAYFLRLILPAQVFFLMGACLTAILYLRKQFLVPALSPLVYNGGIIAGGIIMLDSGMEGFCRGVLVGSFIGNFLLPLWAVAGGGLKLKLVGYHRDLKRFGLLALPLMLGQSVVVLDEQLLRVFGSFAEPGAVSRLNYARRIMLVPVGVAAQAAGVASYPFLAGLAAKQEMERFKEVFNQALRSTLLVIIPISVWMMVAAEPTVRLIFQQGGFDAGDTAATALYLRIMLAAVFCWAVQQITGRAFYALKDTLTPTLVGTGATVLMIPVYFLFARQFGGAGIAAASTLSMGLYTLVLSLLARKKPGPGSMVGVLKTILACGGLSLGAGIPAWAVIYGVDMYVHGLFGAFLGLMGSGLVFVGVYTTLGTLIAPHLIDPFISVLLKPLKRGK